MKKILSLMSCFFLFCTVLFIFNPVVDAVNGEEKVVKDKVSENVIGEIPLDAHHCSHETHKGYYPLTKDILKTYSSSLPSGKYYLVEDIDLQVVNTSINISDTEDVPKDITLCLNGNLLLGRGVRYLYVKFLNKNSKFTLTDCNQTKEHQYYVHETALVPIFDDGSELWDKNYATAKEKGVMKGGIIASVGISNTLVPSASGYSPLTVYGIGTVIVEAGTFAGNYVSSVGSAINLTNLKAPGKFIMNGGAIVGNNATSYFGAAIYSSYSNSVIGKNEIEINDCFIGYNKGLNVGGIYLNNSYFTMNGGTITDNVGTDVNAIADNIMFDRTSSQNNVSKYEINGGNFGYTKKAIYLKPEVEFMINGGNFEKADVEKHQVLNGIPIASNSMIYDTASTANRYRYVVSSAWVSFPTIEDWDYGDKPSEVMGIPAPGVSVKYEYKERGSLGGYTPYDTKSNYPKVVGEYELKITTTKDGLSASQYLFFNVNKRAVTVDLRAVDRLYDKDNIYVELEGGALSNILEEDKDKVGLFFKYKDGDKNLGKLEYEYNNVGEHNVDPGISLEGDASRNYEIVDLDLKAEILEHKLTIKELKFNSGKTPYIGRDIKELTLTAVVLDEFGNEINGTITFQNNFGIVEAMNTKKFVFVTNKEDASKGGYKFTELLNGGRTGYNYNDQVLEFTFEGQQIYMNFIFEDLGNEKYQYSGIYNQVYNAGNIVAIFEEVYEDFKKAHPEYEGYLAKRTPKIKTYNNSGAYKTLDAFATTADAKITLIDQNEIYNTIYVKLYEDSYTVTFNYHYEGVNKPITATYYYGQRVKRPTDPRPQVGKVFIGWYIWLDEIGSDDSQKILWDFSTDVVEKSFTLHAEYMDDGLKPSPDTFNIVQISDYVWANSEVTSKDIRAYVTLVGNSGASKVITIDFANLTIEYFAKDGRIHKADPRIKVSANIDGVQLEKIVELNVRAITVDTSLIKLLPQTYKYDGNAHPYIADFIKPVGVTGYTAIYYLVDKEKYVEEKDVYLPGEYVVTITLTLVSEDYVASKLRTYLTILEPENLTYVAARWTKEEFIYNGKHQQPEYRLYVVENGELTNQDVTNNVRCGFTYEKQGGIPTPTTKDAGKYTIKLVIKSAEYLFAEGELDSYQYEIKPAELQEDVTWSKTEFAYNGKEQTPNPNFTIVGGINVFPTYELNVVAGDGINPGDHTVHAVVTDPNYIYSWPDSQSLYCDYHIIEKNVRVSWDYDENEPFNYNGEIQYPKPRFFVGGNEVIVTGYELEGDIDSVDAGSYTVRLVKESLNGLLEGYQYIDNEELVCSYRILPVELWIDWQTNPNGYIYNGQVQHPTPTIYTVLNNEDVTAKVKYYLSQQPKNAGMYDEFGIIIMDKNYKVKDSKDLYFPFVIEKQRVKAPIKTEMSYNYSGEFYDVLKDVLGEYDASAYQIIGDNPQQKDAGQYKLSIMLKDKNNYDWGASSSIVNITWEIKKAVLTPVWNGFKFVFNNREIRPVVTELNGLKEADKALVDYEKDLVYIGDPAKEVGIYLVSVELSDKASWTKNYILGENEQNYFVTPNENTTVINVEWSFTETWYNGEIQVPKATTYMVDENGNLVKVIIEELTITGDTDSKWAGVYTVTANVPEDGKYVIANGKSHTYEIKLTTDGQGNNPDEGGTTPGGGGEDGGSTPGTGGGDNGINLPKDFPAWQLITGFASILLIVLFVSKGNDKRRKGNRYKKSMAGNEA